MRLPRFAPALFAATSAIALAAAAPAQVAPVTVTALFGDTAQIESGGQIYLCDLARSDVAVTLAGCLPLLTEAQTDRLKAAEAEVARLTEALSASQAETAAALAATEAAVQAALAEALAERDVTIGALEAQVAQLEADLAPFLAANAEAAAALALREKAAALSKAGGDLGRLIDDEVAQLGLVAFQAVGAHFGDRCTLRLADISTLTEKELDKIAYPPVLQTFELDPEIAELMLSIYFEPMNTEGSLHKGFVEAYNAAADDEIYTAGNTARMIARDNMRELDRRMDDIMPQRPDLIALSADQTEITILDCD
jgi:DNA-binding CsgD family transcriptional regulator